jgi:hypothetical protein
MTLRRKQSAFALLVAALIFKAYELGYEVTLGEAYRSKEEAARLAAAGAGIKASLHTVRLAVDLNLFLDGVFLKASEDYRALGEFWERQSTEAIQCCWGGRFQPRSDGNHFSIQHEGRM